MSSAVWADTIRNRVVCPGEAEQGRFHLQGGQGSATQTDSLWIESCRTINDERALESGPMFCRRMAGGSVRRGLCGPGRLLLDELARAGIPCAAVRAAAEVSRRARPRSSRARRSRAQRRWPNRALGGRGPSGSAEHRCRIRVVDRRTWPYRVRRSVLSRWMRELRQVPIDASLAVDP